MRNKEYSWYMLSKAQGFGDKSIHYLYNVLKDNSKDINDLFEMEFDELTKMFPEIGKGKFSRANFELLTQLDVDNSIYTDYENLKSNDINIIGLDDNRYPLSVIQKLGNNAPPILYCKGNLQLLNQSSVSIVGARDIGEFEIMITRNIAQKLANNGINVTSGYAKGVDTAAHFGALEVQGTTVMILSFGFNHLNSKREFDSFNLEKQALFVSQFKPYEKFSGQNAMIRNKLVCAFSRAVVVIKSGPERDVLGKMSGTFDAGKSAIKMGIPVFVLNPDLLSPTPKGNSDIIKVGGIEFSDGMDIVKYLEENPNIIDRNLNSGPSSKFSFQTSLFD